MILHLCQKVLPCIFRSVSSGSAFLFTAALITVFFSNFLFPGKLYINPFCLKPFRIELLPFLGGQYFFCTFLFTVHTKVTVISNVLTTVNYLHLREQNCTHYHRNSVKAITWITDSSIQSAFVYLPLEGTYESYFQHTKLLHLQLACR